MAITFALDSSSHHALGVSAGNLLNVNIPRPLFLKYLGRWHFSDRCPGFQMDVFSVALAGVHVNRRPASPDESPARRHRPPARVRTLISSCHRQRGDDAADLSADDCRRSR